MRPAILDGPDAAGVSVQEKQLEDDSLFNPNDERDACDKAFAEIIRRRGQPKFRKALLRIYGGRCAITGCSVEAALEAAHVTPYRGERTNVPANGILLRSDIHTL